MHSTLFHLPLRPCFYTTATCTSPCLNGGTCTAPDTCTCDVGWTGMQCETGTYITETCLGQWHCPIYYSPVQSIVIISSPATDCGDPGTPRNGQHSLSSTAYNSVVTYTCNVGYTLQGSNSRTCLSDEQWSGSVPQCMKSMFLQTFAVTNCTARSALKLAGQTFGLLGSSQVLNIRIFINVGPCANSQSLGCRPVWANSCNGSNYWILPT